MVKRWIRLWMGFVVSCFLSLVCLPVAVHADALVEVKDSFWEKHQKECDYFFRSYTVNGAEGYAALWESPVSSRQREIVANGTEVCGNWHYTDSEGDIWCAVQTGEMDYKGFEKIWGWIKTSECIAVPDYISFKEAHGEEFEGYDAAYDGAFDGVESVTLWKYPCSGIVAAEQIDAGWFREKENYRQMFDTCWRDPQGRFWAFVGYCYGLRNTWICLDDPAGVRLKEDKTGPDDSVLPRESVVYPAADHLPAADSGVTGLVIGGVLAVVAVTIGLLWFFFLRKKGEKDAKKMENSAKNDVYV